MRSLRTLTAKRDLKTATPSISLSDALQHAAHMPTSQVPGPPLCLTLGRSGAHAGVHQMDEWTI